jgi:DUF4097 and DUF4098 domain-containing protein YvlB
MKVLASRVLPFLLIATHGAVAGTPINETRDLDRAGRIEISNVRGSVTVTTWDEPRVAISGTLGSGSKELNVSGNSKRLGIKVEAAQSGGWFNWGSNSPMEDSILDIKVPREAQLKIDVVSAEVAVSGSAGRSLEIDSVSGRMRVDSSARELDLGSISGNIDIAGRTERAKIETVSGNINSRAELETIKAETVSGDIAIETPNYRELNTSSVSGDISVRGKPSAKARVEAETMSGNIRIDFPADISADISAETFSGRLRSDFGTVKEPDRGPGRSLHATVGNGDARIKIETFSGNITLRNQ